MLCVICLCVKVIIAMICCDLCDFFLAWDSESAISIHSYVLQGLILLLFHFLRQQNFAAINPDHNGIYGGIANAAVNSEGCKRANFLWRGCTRFTCPGN